MAQITASTKEIETLAKKFAAIDISGFSWLFKDGEIAVLNMSVEGDAEFSGVKLGYTANLSKEDGITISVVLR